MLYSSGGLSGFTFLKGALGKASLATVLKMVEQLECIAGVALPDHFCDGYSHALLNKYRMRAGVEDAYQMRRHPRVLRLGLLTIYATIRRQEIIDSLIDALIAITHKISINAEKKVVLQLVSEFTKVRSKSTLLFLMAKAADSNPEGRICDVIHLVVSEDIISNLAKEYKSDGPTYSHRVYQSLTPYSALSRSRPHQALYIFKPNNQAGDDWQIKPDKTINEAVIRENWDDMLRLITTIKLKENTASDIFRRLNSYSRQHALYQTLKAFGQIIKSLFILRYVDDVELRQAIEKQLNKVELANRFTRAVAVGNPREFTQAERE